MQSPSTAAYEAVLNVIHYLFYTSHMGISFGPVDPQRRQAFVTESQPRGWSDASFGGRKGRRTGEEGGGGERGSSMIHTVVYASCEGMPLPF